MRTSDGGQEGCGLLEMVFLFITRMDFISETIGSLQAACSHYRIIWNSQLSPNTPQQTGGLTIKILWLQGTIFHILG